VLPLTLWSAPMDLNRLYSQHQISLIRASYAGSARLRTSHEADARGVAAIIKAFQGSLNTPTATAWGLAL
jgi:hypothetical protein